MPSSSKAQSKLMRAACHDPEVAKKKRIKQQMACHWVSEDIKKAAKDPEFAKKMDISHEAAKQWVNDHPQTEAFSEHPILSKNW